MSKDSREATESAEGAALRMGAAERHSHVSCWFRFLRKVLICGKTECDFYGMQ